MRAIIVVVICLISLNGLAKKITGTWNGAITVQGSELSLVFHISDSLGVLNGTMDSPKQGLCGYELTSVEFENQELK